MKQIFRKYFSAAFVLLMFFTGCSFHQTLKDQRQNFLNLDTVHAGQFDTGKMWTFDFPPIEYFSKTYGFTPDKEWFVKARLSALRLPNCSASFVSEDGLVMTNHHCARSALDSVTREGERLVEEGFYASSLEEERRAGNIYIDQLLLMEDVTHEVQQAFESGAADDIKISQREAKIREIQKRFSEHYKIVAPQDSMIFSVVSFYNGGRFSLYGYKRYTDVRLVYAPEDAIAFFGGDPDNFTYPRYDFDCAFFRIYEYGLPLKTSNYFRMSQEGAKEGDAVFVIGNPGKTYRLETVAQLDYRRDVAYPSSIETYAKYEEIYSSYVQNHPEEKSEYINKIFSVSNSRKAVTGYLNGLRDQVLMAKKKDFENKFQHAVGADSHKQSLYGNLWNSIEINQTEIASLSRELNALSSKGRLQPQYLSLAAQLVNLADRSSDSLAASAQSTFYPSDFIPEIEKQLLSFRLTVLQNIFGPRNKALNTLLAGRTPEQTAEDLSQNCIFSSKEKTAALLAQSPATILRSTDPLIQFTIAMQPRLNELQKKYDSINKKQQAAVQMLGKAMYEVYGIQIPPDATFTLRIADGTVKGYEYNGTLASPLTTFYGMYDRYYSFGMQDPWKLTKRWLNPPVLFKMNTPMNFVSTNDIIGGNSGSPVINKDLQVVGLIFDGNIESLPGNFIYDETKNRSVSVHSSGILEGLEKIYKAERLVKELRLGKIVQ
jgi:hypothetical protein